MTVMWLLLLLSLLFAFCYHTQAAAAYPPGSHPPPTVSLVHTVSGRAPPPCWAAQWDRPLPTRRCRERASRWWWWVSRHHRWTWLERTKTRGIHAYMHTRTNTY